MLKVLRIPKFFWRAIKITRVWYAVGLGPVFGRMVLLLTTTGRKSGLPRVTPLQYEENDGVIYVASARGTRADWFLNILADPRIEVRVKNRRFSGIAEPVTDPVRIADFLELKFKRHPLMMRFLFKVQGFPSHPDRQQLEQYAKQKVLAAINPEKHTDD